MAGGAPDLPLPTSRVRALLVEDRNDPRATLQRYLQADRNEALSAAAAEPAPRCIEPFPSPSTRWGCDGARCHGADGGRSAQRPRPVEMEEIVRNSREKLDACIRPPAP